MAFLVKNVAASTFKMRWRPFLWIRGNFTQYTAVWRIVEAKGR